MTPKDLIEKARKLREIREAAQTYWGEMLPGLGKVPEPQLQSWVSRYSLESIAYGVDSAVSLCSKASAKGSATSLQGAVDYASGAMRKAHFEAMSAEERHAHIDKMVAISLKRSEAGKKGNEKRWHSSQTESEAKMCDEATKSAGNGNSQQLAQNDATVCDDLRPVCDVSDTVVEVEFAFEVAGGFGSGFESVPGSGSEAVLAAAAPRVEQADPNSKEGTKPETKTNTNPVGTSGFLAKQDKGKDKTNANTAEVLVWGKPVNACPFHAEELIIAQRCANAVAGDRVSAVMGAWHDCPQCNPPVCNCGYRGQPLRLHASSCPVARAEKANPAKARR